MANHVPSTVSATMSLIPCQTEKKTFMRREKASFLSLTLSLSVSARPSHWQSQSGSWLSVSLIMNSRFLLASTEFFVVTSKIAATAHSLCCCHPPRETLRSSKL